MQMQNVKFKMKNGNSDRGCKGYFFTFYILPFTLFVKINEKDRKLRIQMQNEKFKMKNGNVFPGVIFIFLHFTFYLLHLFAFPQKNNPKCVDHDLKIKSE